MHHLLKHHSMQGAPSKGARKECKDRGPLTCSACGHSNLYWHGWCEGCKKHSVSIATADGPPRRQHRRSTSRKRAANSKPARTKPIPRRYQPPPPVPTAKQRAAKANYQDEPAYKKPRVSLPSAARCCPGNCGFQVTWHPTHCCKKCYDNHGTHGGKCERKPYSSSASSDVFIDPGNAETSPASSSANVAWGDGIQIPTAQWTPISHEFFVARTDDVM